jgi:hypothetical protein
MSRALADAFFYDVEAIGAMYPGLFEKSDHVRDERKHLAILAYLATMVCAFILALYYDLTCNHLPPIQVQFCLGEWKEGYFSKGTLNANRLLSVFICHYDGLKIVHSRARKHLSDSYDEWFNDAV